MRPRRREEATPIFLSFSFLQTLRAFVRAAAYDATGAEKRALRPRPKYTILPTPLTVHYVYRRMVQGVNGEGLGQKYGAVRWDIRNRKEKKERQEDE